MKKTEMKKTGKEQDGKKKQEELESIVLTCVCLAIERVHIKDSEEKGEIDKFVHRLEYAAAAKELLEMYEQTMPSHVKEKIDALIRPEYIKKFYSGQ